MMSITPVYFTVELDAIHAAGPDGRGRIIGPVRVLIADKILTEATCRKQRWTYADTPRTHLLMGFYALRRLGLIEYPDFETFEGQVLDVGVSNTTGEDDLDEDPTAPGSSS